MAVTLTTQLPVEISQAIIRKDTHWLINFQSADLSGNDIIRAAPAAGLQLVLQYIFINYPFADTIQINETTTAIFGPFTMTSTSPPLVIDLWRCPYPLVAAAALRMDAGAGNIITGWVKGYTTVA